MSETLPEFPPIVHLDDREIYGFSDRPREDWHTTYVSAAERKYATDSISKHYEAELTKLRGEIKELVEAVNLGHRLVMNIRANSPHPRLKYNKYVEMAEDVVPEFMRVLAKHKGE